MQPRFSFSCRFVVGFGVLACLIPRATAADEISFRRDIAPLLQDKCVTCHGPDKQKGGYRLDSFEWLQKPGDGGDAPVVGGRPENSEMIRRVTAADPDDRMPQKSDPLPPDAIEKLRAWVLQGARFDGSNPKQSLVDLAPPALHPAPPGSYPHAIPVLSLSVLGDTGRMAIGGYHEILVCEVANGKLVQRITNFPERIHALLPFDGSRRLLYAGGNPGRIGEMGVVEFNASGVALPPKVLARSTDTFLTVAVRPDGKQAAVGGSDKIIRIIDLESGKEVRQLTQHADWVMGLAYSPDGSRLASASRDGTARVFDPATGETICAFRGHAGPVFDVAFVGNGSHAASAGRDGHVRFWTTDKGGQTRDVGGLNGEVYKLTRAGDALLCAVSNGTVCELSTASFKITKRWRSTDPASPITVAWNRADDGFACGRSSGLIENWKLDANTPVRAYTAWP